MFIDEVAETLSVAVASTRVGVVVELGDKNVWSTGGVMTGTVVSGVMITKEDVVAKFPAWSVAVQMIVVVPTEKPDWEAVIVVVPVETVLLSKSVAVAVTNVGVVVAPVVGKVWSAGGVITGTVVSAMTITLKVVVAATSLFESIAAHSTCVLPSGNINEFGAGVQEGVMIPLPSSTSLTVGSV